MTDNMNKYQYGKIYKIVDTTNPDMVYVGSTTYDLNVRMIKHKCDAKQRPELSKLYTYMNEVGIDKFDIHHIEDYPCEGKEELRKREGELIKDIGTLNQRIAGRSKKEYNKFWSEENREKIYEQARQRRIDNPEKTKSNAKKHRKAFNERHKEELKAKASIKFDCECGGKYTAGHKHEHMNSKRHLKYLGTFNEEEYKNSKRCEQLKQRYEKQNLTLMKTR